MTVAGGPAGPSTFTYDDAGRLTDRTDTAGKTTFTWTDADQLRTARDALTQATQTRAYDAAGQLTSVAYSGGGNRSLAYDGQGRMVSDSLRDARGRTSEATGYTYDANGNLTSQTIDDRRGRPEVHTYGYDDADRLVSWHASRRLNATYAYDDSGNRVKAGDARYTFDQRNRMTSGDGRTYAWDARGALSSSSARRDAQTFTHDALGRLTAWRGASRVDYTYDGLDRVATRGALSLTYQGTTLDPVSVAAPRSPRARTASRWHNGPGGPRSWSAATSTATSLSSSTPTAGCAGATRSTRGGPVWAPEGPAAPSDSRVTGATRPPRRCSWAPAGTCRARPRSPCATASRGS